MHEKTQKIITIAIILSVILISIYLLFNNPNEENSLTPQCLFYKLTSLYCPGCGITRAWYALLHFEFKEAFSQNALAFFVVPISILAFFYPKILYHPLYPIFIFVSTLTFAILRNIEYFSFLAPH